MGDPQRLLSNISDADDLERELLGSIQRVEPAAGAKDEAWARLSLQIAAVALVGTAHGSAAAASAGAAAPGAAAPIAVAPAAAAPSGFAPLALKLLGSKLGLGLALASSAVGASAVWVHFHHGTSATPAAQSTVTIAALQPRASEAEATPAAEAPPVAELVPLPAATPDAPLKTGVEQARKDRLSAESALLTRARAQLRHGDALAAQQTLDQLRTKFPRGVLGQEREVLAIEVLAARGNGDAARKRARAFIAAYPKSPHSAQLSRFADAP